MTHGTGANEELSTRVDSLDTHRLRGEGGKERRSRRVGLLVVSWVTLPRLPGQSLGRDISVVRWEISKSWSNTGDVG